MVWLTDARKSFVSRSSMIVLAPAAELLLGPREVVAGTEEKVVLRLPDRAKSETSPLCLF